MKLIFIIFTAITWLHGSVQAQQKKLQVGDTLPKTVLSNLLNYPDKEISIPAHSGKWTILDFWTTGCMSCVEAFPKIQQLQKEFAGKVEWLMVTFQPKEMIKTFLKKHKKLTGIDLSLPIVCGDSLLTGYFQPDGYPHCVWIDSIGVIRSITNGYSVTESNISAILRDRNFKMEQKDDAFIIYDSDVPLYVHGKGVDSSKLIWSTTLSRYIKGMPGISCFRYTENGNSSISAMTAPIKELYQVAFNNDDLTDYFFHISNSRTEFNIKDTSKYVYYVDGVIQYKNLYCYQAILPKLPIPELKTIMQNDLKRYFGFNARIEKRNRLCWVMSAKDTMMFKSKGGKEWSDWDGSNYIASFTNYPFNQFRIFIEYVLLQDSPFPLVNEFSCSEKVDVILADQKYNDTDMIIKALKKYGISLKLENRDIDVLIIDELDGR